ncbi:MAG: HAMP domain-containing protein, partial [Bacillota bacterium]
MNHKTKHLKLGKNIRGGFYRVTIVIILMMIVSIFSNLILVSFARGIYDGPYKEMQTVGRIEKNLESLEKHIYISIAEVDSNKIIDHVKELETVKSELQTNLEELKEIVPENQISEIDKFQKQVRESYPALESAGTKLTAFDQEGNNDWEGALAIMNKDVLPIFEEAKATLKILHERSEKAASDYLHNAMIAQLAVICLMAAGLFIAVLVSGKISRRLEGEILAPVNELVEVSTSLAKGDINVSILYDKEDEFGVLAKSIREIVVSLKALIDEANSLTKGAVEGKLETRGNTKLFQGGYLEIIQGVNHTLDALVSPLYTSAEYMNRISKGDIPEMITDEYKGDFNGIKESINTCIGAINSLI